MFGHMAAIGIMQSAVDGFELGRRLAIEQRRTVADIDRAALAALVGHGGIGPIRPVGRSPRSPRSHSLAACAYCSTPSFPPAVGSWRCDSCGAPMEIKA